MGIAELEVGTAESVETWRGSFVPFGVGFAELEVGTAESI